MKKAIISFLVLVFNTGVPVLAIEDAGINIWNTPISSIEKLENNDLAKIEKYKELYQYYNSIGNNQKAKSYLDKINQILSKNTLW